MGTAGGAARSLEVPIAAGGSALTGPAPVARGHGPDEPAFRAGGADEGTGSSRVDSSAQPAEGGARSAVTGSSCGGAATASRVHSRFSACSRANVAFIHRLRRASISAEVRSPKHRWSAAHIAWALGKRSSGSRARARAQISSRSRGTAGASSRGEGIGSARMAFATATSVSLRKSGRIVSISKSTMPSANTSVRRSIGRAVSCSGAM